MARALAAMSAPLAPAQVAHAADELMTDMGTAPATNHLLRQGADLMTARRVVEALRALRDAHVTDSTLARWLLAREAGAMDPSDLPAAAERVCQKLGPDLSRLASPAGSKALLARALHVARPQFPFLKKVQAGVAPDTCLRGLSEGINDVDALELRRGLQALLGVLLDLVAGLIGEALTTRLLSEVWPDLPASMPAGIGQNSKANGR